MATFIGTPLPKILNDKCFAFTTQYRNDNTNREVRVKYHFFMFLNNIQIEYGINPKYIHVYHNDKNIMDITQFHIGNVTKIINLINNK